MKKLFQKIQAMLTAASFAEEGEVETARRIMAEAGMDGGGARHGGATLESTMAAAAFAEEGEADTARRLLAATPPPPAPADPEPRPADEPAASPSVRARIPG